MLAPYRYAANVHVRMRWACMRSPLAVCMPARVWEVGRPQSARQARQAGLHPSAVLTDAQRACVIVHGGSAPQPQMQPELREPRAEHGADVVQC